MKSCHDFSVFPTSQFEGINNTEKRREEKKKSLAEEKRVHNCISVEFEIRGESFHLRVS